MMKHLLTTIITITLLAINGTATAFTHQGDTYLQQFLSSPTFSKYWQKSAATSRTGAQTSWGSVSENSLMLIESFEHLIDDHSSWYAQRAGISQMTFKRMAALAKAINQDPKQQRLFYLFMFARDFGWTETKTGQGHQPAGVPIIEAITKELGYDSEIVNFAKEIVFFHSVPAEIYLGETSPRTIRIILQEHSNEFILQLVLLNLLEVNSVKKEGGYLHEENASFIIGMADLNNRDNYLRINHVDRLARISIGGLPIYNPKKNKELSKEEERFELVKAAMLPYDPSTKHRINQLLDTVDFHYTASMFPLLAPNGLARFLKLSAILCLPEEISKPRYTDLICTKQELGRELDRLLTRSDIKDEEIIRRLTYEKDEMLVWDPLKL